jgi:diaminopimelate epimerase
MAPPTRKNRKPLEFYKMHSLGNDFMVLDGVTQALTLDAATIARWGDRHTGVGFDQLLVIEPPTDTQADFWFRIFNNDGSSAEQCGNGTRAVAMLVRHLNLSKKQTLTWQSAAGMLSTVFTSPQQIETSMTVPVLAPAEIPFDPTAADIPATATTVGIDAGPDNPTDSRNNGAAQAPVTQYVLNTTEHQYTVTPVSMGNPHAVIFVDDLFNTDVVGIGQQLTGHPAYPEGANIGFCQIVDRQFMRLRVYERGAGETQACGSGACAAVVAARLHDKVDHRVKVSLPGGKLRISWLDNQSPVTMSGAATLVFRGELLP